MREPPHPDGADPPASVGDRHRPADRAVRVAVPVGLAVLTWLVVLLGAGLVLRLDSPSLLDAVPLVMVVVLLWPLARAAPWRDGMTDRVRAWARRERTVVLVTAGLAVLVALPVAPAYPGPVRGLLRLPSRASGLFFGAAVFYRQRFGPLAGRALLRFGQWYLELFWLYVLSTVLVGLGRKLRSLEGVDG